MTRTRDYQDLVDFHLAAVTWVQIATWNNCIAQFLLFSARVNVYIVDIECILCIAFICRGSVKYKDCCSIWIGILEDCDCVLNLLDKLRKVPPTIKPLSRIDDLPCLKYGKTEPIRKAKLSINLLLRKFDLTNCLANEIGDMNYAPGPLLTDRLLISHEPHMPVVLIGVEYGFILYHQYMLLFPSPKH